MTVLMKRHRQEGGSTLIVSPEEILQRLESVSELTRDLFIDVNRRRVHLGGVVDSLSQMEIICGTVSDMPGVNRVENHMTLRMPTGSGDEDAKQMLEGMLQQRGLATVSVRVHRGTVTLGGAVSNLAGKSLAEQLGRDVPGISRIDNGIAVSSTEDLQRTSPRDDATLTNKANEMFRLAERYLSGRVRGIVSQGTLHLRGRVADHTARRNALHLAHQVEGVRRIRDGIEVG